jgi:hypothetical protein
MNPNLVTIYQCPFPKRRIGRWVDGGYVIADIPGIKYDVLFSGGVCDDISFEDDFIRYQREKQNDIHVYAFDGTIEGLPETVMKQNYTFIRKNIGDAETDQCTNLHSFIAPYLRIPDPCIFVKMDIEGGEVDWIRSLSTEQMNAFAQIVIEFHFPFSQKEIDMFKKLNETHLPVHFHPNNACGTRIHNGVYFPNVFECTYLHKRFFNGIAELNRDYVPNDNVDCKNVWNNEEIWIGHPPFVHFDTFIRKL